MVDKPFYLCKGIKYHPNIFGHFASTLPVCEAETARSSLLGAGAGVKTTHRNSGQL